MEEQSKHITQYILFPEGSNQTYPFLISLAPSALSLGQIFSETLPQLGLHPREDDVPTPTPYFTLLISLSPRPIGHTDAGLQEYVLKKGQVISYKLSNIISCNINPHIGQGQLTLHFSDEEALKDGLKLTIGRVLSWTLFTKRVVGLWGHFDKEKKAIIIESAKSPHMIFIDMINDLYIEEGKAAPLPYPLAFIRKQETPTIKKTMEHEELYCFLSNRTTYLANGDIPRAYYELIYRLAYQSKGLIESTKVIDEAGA